MARISWETKMTAWLLLIFVTFAIALWVGADLGEKHGHALGYGEGIADGRDQMIHQLQNEAELLQTPAGEFFYELPGEAFDH